MSIRNKIKLAERNRKIKQEYKFLRKRISQLDALFLLAIEYEISIDRVRGILWRKSK